MRRVVVLAVIFIFSSLFAASSVTFFDAVGYIADDMASDVKSFVDKVRDTVKYHNELNRKRWENFKRDVNYTVNGVVNTLKKEEELLRRKVDSVKEYVRQVRYNVARKICPECVSGAYNVPNSSAIRMVRRVKTVRVMSNFNKRRYFSRGRMAVKSDINFNRYIRRGRTR